MGVLLIGCLQCAGPLRRPHKHLSQGPSCHPVHGEGITCSEMAGKLVGGKGDVCESSWKVFERVLNKYLFLVLLL